MITVTGLLKIWRNDEGRMHFMSVPAEVSAEIRAHAMLVRRGFGSVRVEVRLSDVTWRTSVFPSKDTGGYFLPVKMDVIRKADIAAGDEISVTLDLL
ncbi:MAG TPA: DUF1905 domain-containing protein [Sphingomicrobium sp.]|nr:DUF1905 domain-containing protein [Sphingomicrobium sp.]